MPKRLTIFNKSVRACRIGLAGCGAMGLPMLKRLLAHGFDACGFDVRPISGFPGSEEHMCMNAGEFAAQVDILISVVRDERQTCELCFDVQKMFGTFPHPRLLVVSSTLSPYQFQRIADMVPSDVLVIDAPMSGAPVAAELGTLTFMVGAEPEHFDHLMPLFSAMGDKINRVGLPGSGMTMKVLNNYVAACSVVAVRRVLERAALLGVPEDRLLEIMRQSSGGTWFGNNFRRIDWAGQGYGDATTIAILEKDVECALDAAGVEPDTFDRALLAALRTLPALGPAQR